MEKPPLTECTPVTHLPMPGVGQALVRRARLRRKTRQEKDTVVFWFLVFC